MKKSTRLELSAVLLLILLKITASYVQFKSGNISESVQDIKVVTTSKKS